MELLKLSLLYDSSHEYFMRMKQKFEMCNKIDQELNYGNGKFSTGFYAGTKMVLTEISDLYFNL
jgi:hypothetical protein